MKKNLLTTAVTSCLALCSFTALADGPTFYGRADLAVTGSGEGYATQNQKDGTVIENNYSWLGVKGSETINQHFDILYQMEFGVENFDNSGNTFTARNTFLGVKTAFGTALIGRNDTVFKAAEGSFDLFGNTNSDIDLLVAGQARKGDGFSYYSPKIADLITLNATYLMNDNYDQEDSNGNDIESDEMYALSATLGDKSFKTQNYYVAAAYNDGIDNIEAYRAVAQVKFGNLMLGALYQNSEHLDDKFSNLSGDTYFVNAAYLLGDLKLKMMYGQDNSGLGKYVSRYVGDNDQNGTLEDVSDVDLKQLSVGADYKLSTKTMVYGHYTRFDGDLMLGGTQEVLDDDVVTVGLRVDF